MKMKCYMFMGIVGLALFSGCQMPTSYEMSVSLVPTATQADPNAPAAKPVDPLDVLIATEKIAVKAGLKPYSTANDEASLLDIADSDLSDSADADVIKVTEWKHPDLPVYLTVTRKNDEILILLSGTPDASGKMDADTARLYKNIATQLSEKLADYGIQIR